MVSCIQGDGKERSGTRRRYLTEDCLTEGNKTRGLEST